MTSVKGAGSLNSVSCPSPTLCVAVDDSGDVVTSNDPTGGTSAWVVTNVNGTTPLRGVSCPTPTLCVAVGDHGNMVTSLDPTGGASTWTPFTVGTPGGSLNSVSCPTTSLCVAVDDSGDVVTSTNPTGAASAWIVSNVDGSNRESGVSCTAQTSASPWTATETC